MAELFVDKKVDKESETFIVKIRLPNTVLSRSNYRQIRDYSREEMAIFLRIFVEQAVEEGTVMATLMAKKLDTYLDNNSSMHGVYRILNKNFGIGRKRFTKISNDLYNLTPSDLDISFRTPDNIWLNILPNQVYRKIRRMKKQDLEHWLKDIYVSFSRETFVEISKDPDKYLEYNTKTDNSGVISEIKELMRKHYSIGDKRYKDNDIQSQLENLMSYGTVKIEWSLDKYEVTDDEEVIHRIEEYLGGKKESWFTCLS